MHKRLPKENPVCVHDWQAEPLRLVYVCQKCGYLLPVYVLYQQQESEQGKPLDTVK